MKNYLVDHALKNVWCAPRQDRQFILALQRITPSLGEFNDVKVLWERLPLPEHGPLFHVYQIGQNTPYIFGLFMETGKWVRASDLCNKEKLIVDFYVDNGRQFPRGEAWFMVTRDRNLIVAVKINDAIAPLGKEQLYLRVYSNAWYSTPEAHPTNDFVKVMGGLIQDKTQYSTIMTAYQEHATRPTGHAYLFHNGMYVSGALPNEVLVGETLEWVYDSSIYKVVDFKLSDLPTFDSELDKKRKYLAHPPKAGSNAIDYRDDIDFFIHQPSGYTARKGLYYHKNNEDAVRMVTHADYSLPVEYVQNYIAEGGAGLNSLDCYLRIHVRRSGFDRPLVFEANRIHELYKLDDAAILAAFQGVNALVDEWRVANLEYSYYTELMRSYYQDVDLELVRDAYGYNAMSCLAGQTPQRPTGLLGDVKAKLPEGLWEQAGVYEYDKDGLLLSVNDHTAGQTYVVRDQVNTKLIEAVNGQGGLGFEQWFGKPVGLRLDPNCEYRVYRTPRGYVPGTRPWADVTGSDMYQIVDGVLVWTNNQPYDYLIVSDKKFVTYAFDLTYRDHLLKFSLRGNDASGNFSVMEIPPARVDVWMNQRALIEGLDYYVKFPQVVICNKEYLNQEDPYVQKIVVRMTGFCTTDLKREPIGDVGFVKNKLLSRNNRFDIRDDKVIRCVVEGRVYHRDQLGFAEENSGVSVAGVRDGAPYVVEEVFVPLRGITPYETQVLRSEAQETDKRVRDYLSVFLPEPEQTGLVATPRFHHLYSPFLAKVIYDIKNGVLEIDSMYRPDKQILEELEPYKYLLPYDPCIFGFDTNYVRVHPHDKTTQIEVTEQERAYLVRVNRLLLASRCELSYFITIKTGS